MQNTVTIIISNTRPFGHACVPLFNLIFILHLFIYFFGCLLWTLLRAVYACRSYLK